MCQGHNKPLIEKSLSISVCLILVGYLLVVHHTLDGERIWKVCVCVRARFAYWGIVRGTVWSPLF